MKVRLFLAAALILLGLGSEARAQCECMADGCYDVGRCGYPPADPSSFNSWCYCNGGAPGWRDCTAEDQANAPAGAQCVQTYTCLGLPMSCGDSGSYDSGPSREPVYSPPAHAEEMQRAQELYAAGQQNARPPAIVPYVPPSSGPAAPAADPAAGPTKVRKLAAKVPPLPKSEDMSAGPALDPGEKAERVPPDTTELKKLLAFIWREIKTGPAKVLDYVLSESPLGNYYQVVKINLWAKDKAFEDMNAFMDLARRGFPEAEVKALLDRQDNRLVEFYWEHFGPPVDLPKGEEE